MNSIASFLTRNTVANIVEDTNIEFYKNGLKVSN